MADQQADHQELQAAIAAVKRAPASAASWDNVEALAEATQQQPDVLELFRAVLGGDLQPSLASEIGRRAVRYCESWDGEASQVLPETLERVLELDPRADWAFERLTVAYTVAERWKSLLDAYDSAIERTDQTGRRMQLLEEVAQVAKDFAGEPDRAVDYMTRLFSLDPSNASLSASLERLLERQERWRDLVALHEARIGTQTKARARDTRLKMAACYLERLSDTGRALQQAKLVLTEAPEYRPAFETVEAVLATSTAPAADRAASLALLKEHYIKAGARADVVRVMEVSLDFLALDERKASLRELVSRLLDLGKDAQALPHQASLLTLDPMPQERQTLRNLAERVRDFEAYQRALFEAGEGASGRVQLELWLEGSRTLEQELGDRERAIDGYRRVFEAPDGDGLAVEAGRRLLVLLGETDREPETLDVLTRMSEMEPDADRRRRVLGQVAGLAERLGDGAAAERAWQARVGNDGTDVEALSALIEASQARGDHGQLAMLLRKRLKASGPGSGSRADMVRLAGVLADQLGDLDGAVELWTEVGATYGEDQETVTALTDILSRANRWPELAEVLEQAAARETQRFTQLQSQLGDAFRAHLERPRDATERYKSTIQVDPSHAAAREGLQALVEDENCRGAAADALAAAFQRTGHWRLLVELLDARLAEEHEPAGKARLLVEAAELYEERGRDHGAALDCYRRAFALSPDDRVTESHIRRLAERLERWEAVVEAYRETIECFEAPAPRSAELRFQEGLVLRDQLASPDAALAAFAEAANVCPERVDFAAATVALACETGHPEQASERLLASTVAKGRVDPEIAAAVEESAVKGGAMSALCEQVMASLGAGDHELSGAQRRALYVLVAGWCQRHCDDAAGGEAALVRAVKSDPSDLPTLRELAAAQRAQPGGALIGTLLRIADLDLGNLDALFEAAQVAAEHVAIPEQRMLVIGRLHAAATSLFTQGREATGTCDAQDAVIWALDHLVRLHREHGEPEQALRLLTDAVGLPFDAEAVQGLRHQAAELATEVGEEQRAIELLRDILRIDARDRIAIERLAASYRSQDRLPELLLLRHHQLGLDPEPAHRLELRLQVVDLLREIEERGGRVASLQANLDEEPGHPASLAALSELLRSQGRQRDLATTLEAQAERLVAAGQVRQGADLWRQTAELCESETGELERAVAAYEKLHEVAPASDASEALARMHGQRGDHTGAARWLQVRLEHADPSERSHVSVALAREQLAAGDQDAARLTLERTLGDDPDAKEARHLLAERYRDSGAHEDLAQLLTEGAERASDEGERQVLLVEVADLYYSVLDAPERAVPALRWARQSAPDDSRLATMEARGLYVAKRYDEAATLLRGLIERFGRKRTAERAELHYQLARVIADAGDPATARGELEEATKMDAAHAPALHMSAKLAAEAGDAEGAERAYRALLMLVRRHPSEDPTQVGTSEVFYALHALAVARADEDQAGELLQSALEAAGTSDVEAQRFQRAVVAAGEPALQLQVLDVRNRLARNDPERAQLLALRAALLEDQLGQEADALEARLQALPLNPDDEDNHSAAIALATRLGALERYLEACGELAEAALPDGPGQERAARLTLRMGQAIESGLGDLDRAAGLFAKVEASGHLVVPAWLALSRVAGARGEVAEQRRVLLHISELDEGQATQRDRNEALYILAGLELDRGDVESAMAFLARGVAQVPDADRAQALLSRALEADPTSEAALPLMHELARSARDEHLRLQWYERMAGAQRASLETLREGVELGLRLGEHGRVEGLLAAASQLAEQQGDEVETAWAYEHISQCRVEAGDVPAAVAALEQAVAHAQGEKRATLQRALAELASQKGGDVEVALRAYEALLEPDVGNREMWEPTLDLLERTGDRERVDGFIERVLQALLPEEDRAYLLLRHAQFLIAVAEAEHDAVPVLTTLVDEQPAHHEAIDLLTGIYQRNGMLEELARLLAGQFDRARDLQDATAVAETALRLGDLYGPEQDEVAVDVYRAALEWSPSHPGLLRALLARLGDTTDLRERGEVVQALLENATGEEAAGLARQGIGIWRELGDEAAAQSALEAGVANAPDDADLRQALESHYAEQQQWRPLADLMVREAERLSDRTAALACYKNAATLYREQLDDLEGAAAALRAALQLVPEERSLLGELARNLAAAGQHATAIADVSGILTDLDPADPDRVDLLRVRASLHRESGGLDAAVVDLEQAYEQAPQEVESDLIAVLAESRAIAAESGDPQAERLALLRSVDVLERAGQGEEARAALAVWAERQPEDLEVLRTLRAGDEAAEHWDGVIDWCGRLVQAETGDAQLEAALALADACDKVGRPADALSGLEAVFAVAPDNRILRARLRQLYEASGAHQQAATMLMQDAAHGEDDEEKLRLYKKAAALLVELGDAGSALTALTAAQALRPEDRDVLLLTADAHTALGQLDQAEALLKDTMGGHRRRRSPELAELQRRMGRVCAARGDAKEQLRWLNQALDSHRKSGDIAAELADAATAASDLETAMKALRAITMMDDPAPLSRAEAFLRQAQIAADRGDHRRAQHWARKAKSLDEGLVEADALLARLG